LVRALQLNLCDSGIASCFTGRSVAAAAEVIRGKRPDVVTLNEVCRDDVGVLERAMSAAHPGTKVASAFEAAADRPAHGPFRCLNGQQYGIGILARVPSLASGHRAYRGIYPVQDPADPEERAWLCLEAADDLLACTTHTASTSARVALAQCRYLLDAAVPKITGRHGGEVVLGADLNLLSGRPPGPQSCLPRGYHRVDDGARQDIVTSPGIVVRSRTVIDMGGTTDHPGLFVELGRRRTSSSSP
jgi:endonuclease/exonuclease/phosphatase family metal-dependent hydrolase